MVERLVLTGDYKCQMERLLHTHVAQGTRTCISAVHDGGKSHGLSLPSSLPSLSSSSSSSSSSLPKQGSRQRRNNDNNKKKKEKNKTSGSRESSSAKLPPRAALRRSERGMLKKAISLSLSRSVSPSPPPPPPRSSGRSAKEEEGSRGVVSTETDPKDDVSLVVSVDRSHTDDRGACTLDNGGANPVCGAAPKVVLSTESASSSSSSDGGTKDAFTAVGAVEASMCTGIQSSTSLEEVAGACEEGWSGDKGGQRLHVSTPDRNIIAGAGLGKSDEDGALPLAEKVLSLKELAQNSLPAARQSSSSERRKKRSVSEEMFLDPEVETATTKVCGSPQSTQEAPDGQFKTTAGSPEAMEEEFGLPDSTEGAFGPPECSEGPSNRMEGTIEPSENTEGAFRPPDSTEGPPEDMEGEFGPPETTGGEFEPSESTEGGAFEGVSNDTIEETPPSLIMQTAAEQPYEECLALQEPGTSERHTSLAASLCGTAPALDHLGHFRGCSTPERETLVASASSASALALPSYYYSSSPTCTAALLEPELNFEEEEEEEEKEVEAGERGVREVTRTGEGQKGEGEDGEEDAMSVGGGSTSSMSSNFRLWMNTTSEMEDSETEDYSGSLYNTNDGCDGFNGCSFLSATNSNFNSTDLTLENISLMKVTLGGDGGDVGLGGEEEEEESDARAAAMLSTSTKVAAATQPTMQIRLQEQRAGTQRCSPADNDTCTNTEATQVCVSSIPVLIPVPVSSLHTSRHDVVDKANCEHTSRRDPSPSLSSSSSYSSYFALGGGVGRGEADRHEKTVCLRYGCPPPSVQRLVATASLHGTPRALNPRPFYGNPSDVQPSK